ncbi:MAG: carbonic anhydrase [Armatimonadota bacterium]
MPKGRFGTVITCIDGRVQEPVAEWLRRRHYLDYVDTITTPGADRALVEGAAGLVEHLRASALMSVKQHGSIILAVVGHHDCTGNPVTRDQHIAQIAKAMQVARSWKLAAPVIGLFLGESGQVEEVAG